MEPRDHASDEALMSAYQAGDAEAFEELVRRYLAEVHAFLARFVGDRTLAEDLCQETFLQVHLSAASFDASQRLRPWLFTIAANKARDRLRRAGRRPVQSLDGAIDAGEPDATRFVDLMVSDEATPPANVQAEEAREAVRRIIETMPPAYREVLLLSYFHNFSYEQIARIVEVPVGTVKSRLHAAVGHFAQRWKRRQADAGGE